MKQNNENITKIETQGLKVGTIAYVFMATAGIITYFLTKSEAILLDGMFNLISAITTIAAIRISRLLLISTTKEHPFGFSGYEVIYILFKNILLLGILFLAFVSNSSKIIDYTLGKNVQEIKAGPILIYVSLMVLICASLYFYYKGLSKKIDNKSPLLATEATALVLNGTISGAAGLAIFIISLLKGTPLDIIIPIGDAIVVLVLVFFSLGNPLNNFKGTLLEIGGFTNVKTNELKKILTEKLSPLVEIRRIIITKSARTAFILVYVTPKEDPLPLENLDKARTIISEVLKERYQYFYFDIVISLKSKEIS